MPETTPEYAVGVDLGGTNLKVALVERTDGIVRQATLPTEAEHGPERVLDRIVEGVQRVVQGFEAHGHVEGIGVGVPGVVSMDRTTVTKPPNIPGWERVRLADHIGPRMAEAGIEVRGPIIAENDANAAALGSAFYGAGVPFDSFIMVTLGTGVGGAIIVDNRLFRGTTGAAGEIGHMTIDYEGPYDRTGVAGALEAYLGQKFLSRHARYQLLARETNLYATSGRDLEHVTPQRVHAAALAGDEAAREVLTWAGHKLGVLLGSIVNLLDIRKVVVGGGVSRAGDFLLDPARDAMKRWTMPSLCEGIEIVQETRGNDVAMLGAARLVFEHIDDAA
ncbi:ROK family protein [Rubrivirga marina]|uniref:Sugar kinase n=1 Tax=Rubrivirga marina TaxID=1196024 RepID=A0A271J1B2_9BACT|nr:ROK family protein [Rubrivirga marina]PAP77282.1 sugar kinase [Rubrivirga marina]